MDLKNRIEDPEDGAELRRRELRFERRREPLIGTSEPLLDDREHVLDAEESIEQNRTVSRLLIMLGVPIGRFPGDIYVRRGNFSFYFPLATSVILSILLTLLFALFRR